MQQILYLMWKEFKQVFRTREMLSIIFVAPMIQMLVLGFAISTEVKNVSLIITDFDRSSTSREILRAFEHTDRFRIVGYESSYRGIDNAIHRWHAQMAIVIPPNFGRDLQRGLQPEVLLIVDGLDGNTAGVALGYATGILRQFGQMVLRQRMLARPDAAIPVHQVVAEDRMWYNLDLQPEQYMIPGIVVLLITIISMLLSAMSMVREKEIGTMEQLMVTPLKRYQIILGKILPFLILAFVELGIVLVVAQFIFSIRIVGSYALLAGLAFLYLFATLGLGIFISTITQTQQQAMFVSWFFLIFMILMSGFFIPIENMPPLLQKITYINPMRYFMYIMREIFQKGSTFPFLLKDLVPMTVFGLLIFTFSVLKFQKRLA
ncbi:MAG: ABC transporter permease [candidate division KSB1 bacterium]|nr:ABC transporter permease [candidate division KSB1 bacterium]MDQ7065870.1 ABC transporter permease [candidate division KSB1 bacterium]